MTLDVACSLPARKPEPVSAGLEGNDDTSNLASRLDRLRVPALQERQ